MRIKTVHRTLGMITFAAAMIFSYIFWKNHALMYVFFAGFALFVSGGFFALCDSSSDCGKVMTYEQIDDGTYTYLGNIGEVKVLKYLDKKGRESNFAVTDIPMVYGPGNTKTILPGISFRKVDKKIIVI